MDVDKQLLIEARIANDRKSTGVAYALWFFLGIISAHRFYLGRPISAILQILSYFIVIGFIWWVVDVFLIPDMVRRHTAKLRSQMMHEYAAGQVHRGNVD